MFFFYVFVSFSEVKTPYFLRLTGFSSSLQVAWSDVENEPDEED